MKNFYKIALLVAGFLVTSSASESAAPGSLDTAFKSLANDQHFSGSKIALQKDGKILVCGYFEKYGDAARNRITRLNADGSNDTSFNPGSGADAAVRALALQNDGKILIGGDFKQYNGTARNGIARLNADGTLDTSFNPGKGASLLSAIAVQADGKILVGGQFDKFNDKKRPMLVRLGENGSLDASFNAKILTGVRVDAIVLLPGEKILIAGWFARKNKKSWENIARLNADGTLDKSFDPGAGAQAVSGVASISVMAAQSDGKIILGGDFETYNGTKRTRIARINSDGTLDTAFNPGNGVTSPDWTDDLGNQQRANVKLDTIAVQNDGKILIGGDFQIFNNAEARSVARLNADGSLDTRFSLAVKGESAAQIGINVNDVSSIVIQPNGQILFSGGIWTKSQGNGILRKNP